MERKLTPTLALIVAGGLAAGIGLARPTNATSEASQPPVAADPDVGVEQAPGVDASEDGYRAGTREGNRGGTPAPSPDEAAQPPADGGGPAAAETATITIQDFAFAGPDTVAPGAALTVNNLDGAAHTLTFRSGEADTGNLAGGASAPLTAPAAPGTYAFFCAIHPSMEGQITVAG